MGACLNGVHCVFVAMEAVNLLFYLIHTSAGHCQRRFYVRFSDEETGA